MLEKIIFQMKNVFLRKKEEGEFPGKKTGVNNFSDKMVLINITKGTTRAGPSARECVSALSLRVCLGVSASVCVG